MRSDCCADHCASADTSAEALGTQDKYKYPRAFDLDDHHHFETDKPRHVCGNVGDMLGAGRCEAHFCITGDKRHHFDLFERALTADEAATR